MTWKNHLKQWVFACGLISLSSGLLADAASLERGKATAMMCGACHQVDGNGLNNANSEPWPRIAGLDQHYLIKQLNDFKSGKRVSASMQPFANMLTTDQQVADVAAYFASLPASINTETADKKLLARGKQLAEQGDWNNYIVPCSTCHGPDNQGVGADFPQLAGQHPAYISKQLTDWKNGARSNDPQDLMASIAKRLSADDIEAVSVWLASQKAQ